MTDTDTAGYQAAFEQVQRLLNAGAFEQALEQVDLILEVHPRDAKSAYARAVILRRLGQHAASVALLETLVQGTQSVPAVYEEYGQALHAVGRIDDAIGALRAAVALNPKSASSWRLLGESLHSEGEAEEAEAAIRQAMAVTHAHPGIVKALEMVQQEQLGMAEGICRDYLQRNPRDVSVIRLLAEIGIKLGIKGDPELLLEDCLRMAPDFHLARNTYASALGQAQKYALLLLVVLDPCVAAVVRLAADDEFQTRYGDGGVVHGVRSPP